MGVDTKGVVLTKCKDVMLMTRVAEMALEKLIRSHPDCWYGYEYLGVISDPEFMDDPDLVRRFLTAIRPLPHQHRLDIRIRLGLFTPHRGPKRLRRTIRDLNNSHLPGLYLAGITMGYYTGFH